MKLLFHLGHPAHFHLFKNVISSLKKDGHTVFVLSKKKDVLDQLLIEHDIEYFNLLPEGRKDNKIGIALGQIKQDAKMLSFCLKNKPDILIGTSVSITHVGKLINKPSININEDDADVVPLYSKFSYPFATTILVPQVCRIGKWKYKTVFYNSYHELAYLHPNNFKPNIKIVTKYISVNKPYFILRFAKLGAHHDAGIKGISNDLAIKIIKILEPYGNVYITSERVLSENLEKYRVNIDPKDMHDLMAFASLYIGDSQTMAAEAGVLGVPFIRFNDFVGKISYLDELENKYQLGFGIKTDEKEKLFIKLKEILKLKNRNKTFSERRHKMLDEKIDYAKFLIWFIENYPGSVDLMKKNPNYQYRFK